jgi:hypothetical protein
MSIKLIHDQKMGRPANSGELTVEQQNEVQKNLIDKYPEQLKLSGCLWDRDNVRLLATSENPTFYEHST